MLPGPGPPGLHDPESGRPVDLDTILLSTGVSDMVNDFAALELPGPGVRILNGCADLADLFLLGTPSTYITGLAGLSSGLSSAPSLGPLLGEPLRLWGPLLTPTVQSWQQFPQSCAHHWLVPPLGPALGPLMGEPLRLWEPLSISIVYPPN